MEISAKSQGLSHFVTRRARVAPKREALGVTTRRIGRLDWAGTGKLGHAALLGTMQS